MPPLKLPLSHLAIVERSKVVEYLLDSAHPHNGGKAQFFESLGFSADLPGLLIAALRSVGTDGEVVDATTSAYGEKYVVDGVLSSQTRMRRSRIVRTVWIFEPKVGAPRLITAYPVEGEAS